MKVGLLDNLVLLTGDSDCSIKSFFLNGKDFACGCSPYSTNNGKED